MQLSTLVDGNSLTTLSRKELISLFSQRVTRVYFKMGIHRMKYV